MATRIIIRFVACSAGNKDEGRWEIIFPPSVKTPLTDALLCDVRSSLDWRVDLPSVSAEEIAVILSKA